MSGFSIDWLDLREAADQRARDQDLLERAGQWLLSATNLQNAALVVDLGAGTGATLRAFARFFTQQARTLTSTGNAVPSGRLSWRLVDHDQALLAEADNRHGEQWQLETCQTDLAQADTLPLDKAHLVTASALFDLVSASFITALAEASKARSQGVYAALNYDGSTQWTPTHPLDHEVLQAFNRDQRRDKGLGPALGPDATATMKAVFERAGFAVFTASSPWLLTSKDSAMVTALIAGIYEAVQQDPALDVKALAEWRHFRDLHVTTGTCRVGHQDLLALPAKGLESS